MTLLIVIIILALLFDYINGFHDAANSIATVVSTKVLTPVQAVVWAALFNFAAFFIFKDHGVANTITKTVKTDFVTLEVIASGLIGAIIWNLVTWWKGIPSSSSHTLIGGFAGAAIAHGGFASIESEPVIKTASFIILAPLVGMLMAFIISVWFLNSFRKGPAPKIVSIAIMTLIGWLIWANIDTHPNVSKVKTDTKEVEFSSGKHSAYVASVYDASEEDILNAWKKSMQEKKAAVTGVDELSSSAVNISKEISKPFDLTLRVKEEKPGVHKIMVGAVSDSTWLAGSADKKNDSLTSVFVNDFAKGVTKAAPIQVGKMIISKTNFKWLLLGFVLFIMGIFTLWLSNLNNAKSTLWFKRLQLVSSAAFSIGHGGNDAQKVMGIIAAALIAGHQIDKFEDMPNWVPLACYAAIALGTLSGGWKIVKTMGTRITKVTPFEGVAAETAGAVTLFLAENLKIPVSTTHTIAGSIMGVGATKRLSAVRWGVTVNLLWAWILTIPVTALLSAAIYWVWNLFI